EQLRAAAVERVVVLPDNDDVGRVHAEAVARSCDAAGLKVKMVALPNLPLKGDVSDWIEAGHTRDELIALVKATAEYTPANLQAASAYSGGLELTALSVLLGESDEATNWLVVDRIASGTVNLLAGKPKAGKSTAARVLAL